MVKSNIMNDAQTNGDNAEFIGIAKMTIDIHPLNGGVGFCMGRHGAVSSLVRSHWNHQDLLLSSEAGAIIKTEKAWTAIFRYGRTDNGHKVFKVVIEKDICGNDETAGIIDQGDKVHTFLSTGVQR